MAVQKRRSCQLLADKRLLVLASHRVANGRVVDGTNDQPRNATGAPASCNGTKRCRSRNRVTTGGQ
jgi:hypothetical protein